MDVWFAGRFSSKPCLRSPEGNILGRLGIQKDSKQLIGGLEPWNFTTFHSVGFLSSSQLTFTPSFFRGVGQPPTSRYHSKPREMVRRPLISGSQTIFKVNIKKALRYCNNIGHDMGMSQNLGTLVNPK